LHDGPPLESESYVLPLDDSPDRQSSSMNMCAPGFIRTTGALVYTEVPAAASFACGVFELPQGNCATDNGRCSSAADTIARPVEVARVERIALSGVSARTPGRQGVR